MLQCLRINIKIMEAVDTTVDTQIIASGEDRVSNADEVGEAAAVAVSTVI